MKKKIVALIAISMFAAGISGTAFAGSKEVSGKVDEVLGNKITVEIKNGMADFSVGDMVEIEVKKKAEKEDKKEEKPDAMGGMDMMQGC